MLDWLKTNLTGDAIALLLAVATWAYHKVKGDKTASIKDTVWNILRGVAIKLAESDTTVDQARLKLTEAAWAGLARIGVKRTATLEGIVNALVERGITEMRERIVERKQLEAKIIATLATADGVNKAFTPPATPTVPKLEPLGEVEIVKP